MTDDRCNFAKTAGQGHEFVFSYESSSVMKLQLFPLRGLGLRGLLAVALALPMQMLFTWTAGASLLSGTYTTVPNATVEERGDRVTNGVRVVSFAASVTIDLAPTEPQLSGVLSNAVLEGSEPFELGVQSSSGYKLPDGSPRIRGDYLAELYPEGTQYGFDWTFSTTTNGKVMWNGGIGWYGGHIWLVTITNIEIVPVAVLEIAVLPSTVRLSWAANVADYLLESADSLPATTWSSVPDAPSVIGDRFVLDLPAQGTQRYFRLRKP